MGGTLCELPKLRSSVPTPPRPWSSVSHSTFPPPRPVVWYGVVLSPSPPVVWYGVVLSPFPPVVWYGVVRSPSPRGMVCLECMLCLLCMAGMVCDACMVGIVWMVGMLCESVGYGMFDMTLWSLWYVWLL